MLSLIAKIDVFINSSSELASKTAGGYNYLKYVLSMLVVIILIFAFVFILKKLNTFNISYSSKPKKIKIIEKTYLSQTKSFVLLEFNNNTYLVAMDNSAICLLDKTPTESIENGFAEEEKQKISFKDLLLNKKERK